MSTIVVYEGTGEWSAVYCDGVLQRVGDHYLADEWVRAHFGVTTIQSDDFMQGGDQRDNVADSIDQVEAYTEERESRARLAAELRRKADVLLKEADDLLS